MAKRDPGFLPTSILHHLGDGSCKTIEELEAYLGLNRRQISDGAAKLVFRKYLLRMAPGCYQLSKAGIAAAAAGEVITSGPTGPHTAAVRNPVSDTFRERAWRAMRVRRNFTVADIVSDASVDGSTGLDNARRYITYLVRSGFIVESLTRVPGTKLTSPGTKRFRLVRETGPRAPVFRQKLNAVHDFNTGEDVACKSS